MGYVVDGGIFCVAPVALQPYADVPVYYWAVGEDCCQMRSHFDCGTARDADANTAVVERSSEVYAKAIDQAVSVYGVKTTTNSSKMVSFVSDPQAVIGDIWDEALTIALIAMILDLGMCAIVGLVLAKISSCAQPSPQQPLKPPTY
mmetsp:Transcript_90036/g.278502  ORF Transcript_90036/g.278502 Transcript_90036/m.278502 type:complete len:146 (-) Transcript_90036:140-577(-)